MAMMFACMKRHDFSEALCAKEITTFQNCFTEYDVTNALLSFKGNVLCLVLFFLETKEDET